MSLEKEEKTKPSKKVSKKVVIDRAIIMEDVSRAALEEHKIVSKLVEEDIDAEIDRLAEQFKEIASKEPQTMVDRFTKVMLFQEPDRMPIFAAINDHAAKVAGITFREMCTDPKKMLYAQIYAAVKYKLDVVMLFGDAYNFEAEALGAKMLFPEDSFPVILEPLIKKPSDLEKLEIPDFTKDGRGPYVLEGLKLYIKKLGGVALPFAAACAPWSMALQIRGYNNLIKDTRKNPEFAHRILDFCTDVIEAFVKTQQKALGDVMAFPALADAFACIPPTSPKLFYDYIIPHTQKAIKRLGMGMWAGGSPTIEIPGWEQIVEDILTKSGTVVATIGAAESDWMPPEKIKEISKRTGKPVMFGTRAGLISKGTPGEIENFVRRTIKVLGPGGGCILMGDQIPKDTPPENVHAFVNSIKKHGKYPISIE